MPSVPPAPVAPAVPPRPRPAGRRRKLAWFGVVLVVSGVPAGWYFGGGYDRWQDGRALRGLCAGAVDTAEVRELFHGAGRLSGYDSDQASGLAGCTVTAPGRYATLGIDIGWEPRAAHDALWALGRNRAVKRENVPVVPVGAGWVGVLSVASDDRADLVLALPCTAPDLPGQLIVSLRARPSMDPHGPTDDFAPAEQRARLGRIAGRIASRANGIWRCGAPLGGRIERVSGRADVKVVPQGGADGTCAEIPGPVRETPVDRTVPMEDCTVLTPDGKGTGFRMSAYYPPYAQDAEANAGLEETTGPGRGADLGWTTASCPGGEALFLGYRVAGTTVAGDDAFKAFARRSAERHGCSEPALS
ncbi:hypothetical protein [Kitasatospora phosalacinea]|uniref:hypothetical protein n=1 Tax=Kitasatospora phosalacinea TaxID=2065 RepID=UPI0012FE83C1|nr:hypothetical protein [Kitasatospora phosalacinea]